MRNHFANVLEKLMDDDEKLILLYGDIGNRLFDSIKAKFPSRAMNCGVAEANMVSIAAGLASVGLRPIVYTISSFLYLKGLEQMKLDACYPNRSIIFVGTGGGLSYAGLGTTHHSLEDFCVLGSLPNMALFSPADRYELELVLSEALRLGGPAWIRLGKKGEPIVHAGAPKRSGKSPLTPELVTPAMSHRGHNRVVILATGLLVHECVEAAMKLRETGGAVEVWSIPQLKPFPEVEVRELLEDANCVITVEEHVPLGSLHSRVLACLNLKEGLEVHAINSGDFFHTAVGTSSEAKGALGLDASGIFDIIARRVGKS